MVLSPLRGNILDLRGSISKKEKPIDFKKLREDTKKKVGKRVIEEMRRGFLIRIYLIRFLTDNVPERADACEEIFEKAVKKD